MQNAMTGDELRALRKQMNLRQAPLAEALGLTPQFIGMMERNVKAVEPRTAMAVRYLFEHPEDRPSVDVSDIRSYGISELMDSFQESTKLRDGREWGPWRFSADSMTLDYLSREVVVDRDERGKDIIERREVYYVTLRDMVKAKHVLDWIGQIGGKGWGPVALGYFVEALDDIFYLQGTYAHGEGFQNSDAVSDYLRERVANSQQGAEASL